MVCLVVAPPPTHELTVCGSEDGTCQDPLVLDLNGDGIHTTSVENSVWFDIDGDGALEPMAWTDPATDEGFLYLDLDHKGRVTNGSELFGVGTVMPDGSRGRDGFTALSRYDGNADAVLDANDDIWPRLRIWVDRNHNGICDPSETGPIAAYGVKTIDITPAVVRWNDNAGNLHVLTSSYRRRRSGDYAIDAISFQRVQ